MSVVLPPSVIPDWLHRDISLQITAPLLNDPERRSPSALEAVVRQFVLELGNTEAHRYQKRDVDGRPGDETFCNFFVNEVTKALGCEIPKQRANDMITWLHSFGTSRGWWQISGELARVLSLQGLPVIAAWRNPDFARPGHVALLVPPAGPGIWIAQAGARCFPCDKLAAGFGNLLPNFYAHH
jgi:hypothetical protein